MGSSLVAGGRLSLGLCFGNLRREGLGSMICLVLVGAFFRHLLEDLYKCRCFWALRLL